MSSKEFKLKDNIAVLVMTFVFALLLFVLKYVQNHEILIDQLVLMASNK